MTTAKKPITVSINDATRDYSTSRGWLTNATQTQLSIWTTVGATYSDASGTTLSATLTVPRDADYISFGSGALATCTFSVSHYLSLAATWVTLGKDALGTAYPRTTFLGGEVMTFPVAKLSNKYRLSVGATVLATDTKFTFAAWQNR